MPFPGAERLAGAFCPLKRLPGRLGGQVEPARASALKMGSWNDRSKNQVFWILPPLFHEPKGIHDNRLIDFSIGVVATNMPKHKDRSVHYLHASWVVGGARSF